MLLSTLPGPLTEEVTPAYADSVTNPVPSSCWKRAAYGSFTLSVMVIDPVSNQILNRDGLEDLGDAGTMAPQAVVDRLVSWTEHPAG